MKFVPTTAALAVCSSLVAGSADAATVNLLDSGSYTQNSSQNTHTIAVDAGAGTIQKLVLSLHTETSATFSSIQYNGVDLTLIAGTGHATDQTSHVGGIWELDNPALASGNIVVTYAASASAKLGVAFAALGSSDGNDIGVGSADRVVHATAGGGQQNYTIDLAVPNDDSFVFVAGGGNGGSRSMTAQSPLTRLPIGSLSSMAADAGYDEDVDNAGSPHTYTVRTNATGPQIAAASFYVVPEPSSLALLGLGGLMMIKRRRRS